MVKLAVVRANGKYPGNTPAVAGPPTHISSSVAELGGLDLTGKAAVLNTAGRKPVQVRVLCPPLPSTMTRGIMPRRDYVARPARIARVPPTHSEILACRPASTYVVSPQDPGWGLSCKGGRL